MASLFNEIKRRKVFNVAAVYAVVAWVVVQIADIILPTFNAPAWINQTLILFLFLGFPIALILAWAYEITPEGVKAESGGRVSSRSSDRLLTIATFALVLVVAIVQLFGGISDMGDAPVVESRPLPTISSSGVLRAALRLDETLEPPNDAFTRSVIEITPDGSRIFYTEKMPTPHKLFTRLLGEPTSELLVANSGSIASMVLSPDGQELLLRKGSSRMSVLPISGLNERRLDEPAFRRGLTWVTNDEILVPGEDRSIYQMSLETGEKKSLTLAALQVDEHHVNPRMLPGNKAILFGVKPGWMGSGNAGTIRVMDLQTEEYSTVIRGGYDAKYAPSGHIVFMRHGDLWAAPFDLETLDVVGREVQVISGVNSAPGNLTSTYAFSETGRLVYLAGNEMLGNQITLVWMNARGEELGEVELPAKDIADPQVSPDGQHLAVTVKQATGGSDIWIYSFADKTFDRRTFEGRARNGVWTADGQSLVYATVDDSSIWKSNAFGLSKPELLHQDEDNPGLTQAPESVSKVSGMISFTQGRLGAGDIFGLSDEDNLWRSMPLLDGERNTWGSDISHDGNWIAYTDSNSANVFVSAFPDMGSGKLQVSFEGGREPRWSPVELKLYYIGWDERALMEIDIDTSAGISASVPKRLFPGNHVYTFDPPSFAVSHDGQRFLMMRSATIAGEPIEGNASFELVDNWFEELRRIAPPNVEGATE